MASKNIMQSDAASVNSTADPLTFGLNLQGYSGKPPQQNTSGHFPLSTQSYHKRPPWDRPPYTFLTASTSTCFAAPEIHRAMITLWNVVHTSTKMLPQLLQKGMGGMKS